MNCPKCDQPIKKWNKEWDISIPYFFDWYLEKGEIYSCGPCHVIVIKDAEKK